jgi:5-methylcytosine-specific restriction protein B
MESFSRLVAEKRVVFTTFHQSMDYEDFVEGLKPFVDDNKNVYYDVVDGIFKTICKDASKPIIRNNSIDLNPDATIWKVSLRGTYENEVRTECLKNGHIRIGWDEYGENYEEQLAFERGGRIVLDAFYNKMSEGDIVLSCYSNKLIDAIGIIEGEPEWHDEFKSLKRLRKVRWLINGIKEDITKITGKVMTQSTIYRMNDVSVENVLDMLKAYSAAGTTTSEKNTKPYVIVIDEINRGNVSKIFGELITLLESDKRTDGAMPLTVRLPYSKTDFGIPSNLYLIGTMNTADRSLSQFDYAIRRRFRFITMAFGLVDMKPAPGKVFQKEIFAKVSKLFISNYDEYLQDANVRLIPAECFSLEFKPIDLWIGPSYFITDENEPDSLRNSIFYEIIPTLEHYLEDGVFVDEAPVNAVIEELKNTALKA